MRKGEIRRVRNWDYVGHEATGNRPCLIISPDWFNSNGNVIIAPLTTPGPNHEHWWEIHIRATDSTCLVPDIRTVPMMALEPSVLGNVTQYELDDVTFALYRLIGGFRGHPRPRLQPRGSLDGRPLGHATRFRSGHGRSAHIALQPSQPHGDDSVRDRETPRKVTHRIPHPIVDGTHWKVSTAGPGQGHFGSAQTGGPGRHRIPIRYGCNFRPVHGVHRILTLPNPGHQSSEKAPMWPGQLDLGIKPVGRRLKRKGSRDRTIMPTPVSRTRMPRASEQSLICPIQITPARRGDESCLQPPCWEP